jgi:catechol 2,3-dioxygenase-like lactoylglutathione lyase family enzyme
MAAICTCCSTSVDWWVRLRAHPDLPICHNCLAGLNGQRDGQLQLISGKSVITGFEPIFQVADVTRSVAWFEDAGFETSFHYDTYAFAHRDRDLTIHLAQADGDKLPGHGSVYLHCQDADRAAEEWRQAGIEVDGPRDEDYGKREGSIADPDGNVIRFGSPIRWGGNAEEKGLEEDIAKSESGRS